MQPTLKARLTQDRHGKPLVVLDELPGWGVELYPDELRQLARQINTLANMSDQGERGAVTCAAQEDACQA